MTTWRTIHCPPGSPFPDHADHPTATTAEHHATHIARTTGATVTIVELEEA